MQQITRFLAGIADSPLVIILGGLAAVVGAPLIASFQATLLGGSEDTNRFVVLLVRGVGIFLVVIGVAQLAGVA